MDKTIEDLTKVIDIKQMHLLPPAKGLCQICATDHQPHYPHNKDSLYYMFKFNMDNGRAPTWDDAMEHCTEEMKVVWMDMLDQVKKEREDAND